MTTLKLFRPLFSRPRHGRPTPGPRSDLRADSAVRLGKSSLYMLPTPHGLVFTLALLVMLLMAVNYNNGLAYGFVFLVAGMAAVSMLFTHRNLSGLEVAVSDAPPVFAGQEARFPVRISNSGPILRRSLWLLCGDFRDKLNVAARSGAVVTLPVHTQARGYLHPPGFRLSSAYPFGLLYTWSKAIRAAHARVLVYPRPEGTAPLPRAASYRFESGTSHRGGDDFVGLRDYQTGDSPRHVHWKAAAANLALVTKQFGGADSEELWLDWDATIGSAEARLSQLCQWVCQAEQDGRTYGLRLPGVHIDLGAGPGHRHACLQTLALWGIGDAPPV